MATKKGGLGKGLGRGIGALIPESKEHKTTKSDTTKSAENKEERTEKSELLIKITDIEPNKEQPRKDFEEDALQELADSIKEVGIIQPIIVQKNGDYYKIVAGERRWRAAKIAGIKEIPAIVKDYSPQQVMEIALIENIQREDLNPIEEAKAYEGLMKEFSLKQDDVANKVSKSRAAISNSMRLLKLDKRVQQMLIEDKISSGHARALLAVTDKEQQYELATYVFDNNLSVREVERKISQLKKGEDTSKEEKKRDPEAAEYKKIEEKLKMSIGSNVTIKRRTASKGKIEIDYSSREEFERLFEMLQKIKKS